MQHRIVLVVALLFVACDPGGWPPPPIDPPPSGTGKPPETEPCDGVLGGITADDPCCPVHQCLIESPPDACIHLQLCRDLAPDGVVCGDQMCEGGPCEACGL